ncbi:response regulator [Clostridium grantii]|uniref:Stage 0 sporulation protein A homolog n=1 Tax=Clostridium grantii DSM 8605 TaxID=1121316 RepID=A0A1M5WBP2_9CLOT|nr:response regulator transcription factor [Clostridium grantii]SHH84925.1 two component transcriptional regulator, LuxR family [Clostridium grantii DSM 8605]
MSALIRMLIVDDDPLIRNSLKIILEMDDNIDVVGIAENGFEAIKICKTHSIDIALLDVRMPVMNGVEAIKDICMNTSTKCIMLTTFEEDQYIAEALNNGARGYLLKNNPPDKIIDAIKLVYSGNTVFGEVVLERLKSSISKGNSNDNENAFKEESFTDREWDVIKAIASGYSNKEISSELFISEGTVKNYISNILSKTELKHRTQIAIKYLENKR